jgi:N-acetyl-anhydromuramyl-L-alanine amidase AmpD
LMMTDADPPTDIQYESLVRLLSDIKRRHAAITLERIVGHDTIRSYWNFAFSQRPAAVKIDPGPLFNWSRLHAGLRSAGF